MSIPPRRLPSSNAHLTIRTEWAHGFSVEAARGRFTRRGTIRALTLVALGYEWRFVFFHRMVFARAIDFDTPLTALPRTRSRSRSSHPSKVETMRFASRHLAVISSRDGAADAGTHAKGGEDPAFTSSRSGNSSRRSPPRRWRSRCTSSERRDALQTKL